MTRITSRSFDHVEQPKYMDTIVKKDLLSKGLLQRMTQFVLDGLVQQKLVTKKHYLTKKVHPMTSMALMKKRFMFLLW